MGSRKERKLIDNTGKVTRAEFTMNGRGYSLSGGRRKLIAQK
jgi:hypothetical protein